MLLEQIPVHDLKLVSSSLWNVLVGVECPWFYLVEIVGTIRDLDVISVFFENLLMNDFNGFFFFFFSAVLILKEPKNDFLVKYMKVNKKGFKQLLMKFWKLRSCQRFEFADLMISFFNLLTFIFLARYSLSMSDSYYF